LIEGIIDFMSVPSLVQNESNFANFRYFLGCFLGEKGCFLVDFGKKWCKNACF